MSNCVRHKELHIWNRELFRIRKFVFLDENCKIVKHIKKLHVTYLKLKVLNVKSYLLKCYMYINSKKWSYKISKIEILQAVVNEAF